MRPATGPVGGQASSRWLGWRFQPVGGLDDDTDAPVIFTGRSHPRPVALPRNNPLRGLGGSGLPVKGESGAKALGCSADDPGSPVTHDDIVNGNVPSSRGGTMPPAQQIR